MRASRVFRAIWRVDGVLILLVFIVAGVAILAEVSSHLLRRHGAEPAETAASPEAGSSGGEHLAFGSIDQLEGTAFVVVPLLSRPGDSGSFSSGDGERVRNLLFYDTATGNVLHTLSNMLGWTPWSGAWSPTGHALVLNSYAGVYLLADPGNPNSQLEQLTGQRCFAMTWNPRP